VTPTAIGPGPYPWILRRPAKERPLPPVKPSRLPVLVCGRCGCESKDRRKKKCPACHARFEVDA
jgi:rubrerythrin